MKIEKFTDPITGLQFTAVLQDDTMIVNSPVSPEKMKFTYNNINRTIEIPLRYFYYPYLIPASEASEMVGLSKQRLIQLEHENKLQPVFISKKKYYLNTELIQYMTIKRKYDKRTAD